MALGCIVCQIVAGEASAHVVAQDERTIAFLDIGAANEGRTLVVPRLHARDIWDVAEVDAAAVMTMAKRIAELVDSRLNPDGLNL